MTLPRFPRIALAAQLTACAALTCPDLPADGTCGSVCAVPLKGARLDTGRDCVLATAEPLFCHDATGQNDEEGCMARTSDGAVFRIPTTSFAPPLELGLRECTSAETSVVMQTPACDD